MPVLAPIGDDDLSPSSEEAHLACMHVCVTEFSVGMLQAPAAAPKKRPSALKPSELCKKEASKKGKLSQKKPATPEDVTPLGSEVEEEEIQKKPASKAKSTAKTKAKAKAKSSDSSLMQLQLTCIGRLVALVFV